jgi:phenolic acid decarboxylase
VLSGTDAACFGLVNEYLAHLADRNCSPREVLDLLAFCRWLRDEDVELARVTTAVMRGSWPLPLGRESPDLTACPLLQPALAVR